MIVIKFSGVLCNKRCLLAALVGIMRVMGKVHLSLDIARLRYAKQNNKSKFN